MRCGGAPCWIAIDWAILICIEPGRTAGPDPLDTGPRTGGLSTAVSPPPPPPSAGGGGGCAGWWMTTARGGGVLSAAHLHRREDWWYARCTSSDAPLSNLILHSTQKKEGWGEEGAEGTTVTFLSGVFRLMSLVPSCGGLDSILNHCRVSHHCPSLGCGWGAGSSLPITGQPFPPVLRAAGRSGR